MAQTDSSALSCRCTCHTGGPPHVETVACCALAVKPSEPEPMRELYRYRRVLP